MEEDRRVRVVSPERFSGFITPRSGVAEFFEKTIAFRGRYIPILPLIAAANNCDEPVALAAGGTEPRYACNGGFPLTASRGEVLQNLLTACGGRISYAGGQFIIYPAAWPGVSLAVVPYRTELPC